ncbi:Uncharacterised protein [Sphingomonas paucimobilis]|nr:Uncharacterised protein [Sphingomonas paucimobilis]
MGNMVDGVWHADGLFKSDEKGSFKRPDSGFRDWVTADGEPGPDGQTATAPSRDAITSMSPMPALGASDDDRPGAEGLESMIDLSVVDPLMRDDGWTFATERGGTGDPLHGSDFLWQLYARAREGYSGKVTVPVLWDKQRDTIVSNESAEIIRMFNSAFDELGASEGRLLPPPSGATKSMR